MARLRIRASAYAQPRILGNGAAQQRARCLHMTSIQAAQPSSRMSPKTRSRLQPQQGAISVQKAPSIEDYLPPLVLLNSARKSGVLNVEPEKALEFLRQYLQLSGQPGGTWERRLCDEHKIDPSTVATLAGILRRSQNKPQQFLAKRVMLSASALGEKSATLDLITSALNTSALHEYTEPLQRLGILAKKENDPQAWTLLGRVYNSRKNPKEALECFRKATRPPTGHLDFYGAADALVYEGKILLAQNDRENAKAAFEKAALELDDPAAYFYLSKLQEPGSSQEQVYLLKAASSGVKEAWHNLGALELAKRTAKSSKLTKLEDFGMAYEWFQVAATDGFGPSMLNLALMCKSTGKLEDGLKWLDKAQGNPEVSEEAKRIRAQFEDNAHGRA